MFYWPENIESVFELSQTRLQSKRESIEEELKVHLDNFKVYLDDLMKDIESFKRKEVINSVYYEFLN